jgi:hypothetical protein
VHVERRHAPKERRLLGNVAESTMARNAECSDELLTGDEQH